MEHPTHIVAVMGIVRNKENVLLVKSPVRGWEPPGGQVENGEDLILALKREILEESGIEVNVNELLAIYSNIRSASTDKTKVMMLFSCDAIGGSLRTSPESCEVGWFSPEEAIGIVTHPSQRHKLENGLSGDKIIYVTYMTNPFRILDCRKI